MRIDKYENQTPKKEDSKKDNGNIVKSRVKKKEEENKEKKGKGNKFKIIIIIFIFIIIILYLISRLVFPNIISVKETKIENILIPNEFNGFKIVQISDIHYGTSITKDKLNKIVKNVNELKPDIIIFTGDLFDKDISYTEDNLKDIEEELSNLEARLFKFAISGNEDANNNNYYTIIDNADFILLDNKEKVVFNNGITPIVFFGFPSYLEETSDYSILNNEDYKDYYKIVLVHEPDSVDRFENADIVFAGHTLGGIINIGKPLIKFEGAKRYYKFEHHIENTDLFISNGLGTNKLNIRFNAIPNINLYRLYSKTED